MLKPTPRTVRVAIIAFDGCMSSAVLSVFDALALANHWLQDPAVMPAPTTRFSVRMLAAKKTVIGSSGFMLTCDALARSSAIDVAIVPPVLERLDRALADNGAAVTWLARHARRGGVSASICTGAFFLAAAGLLAGKRATTNPAFAAAFRRAHPDVTLLLERRLVDEGRVLTAGSTTAFLDLAIHLIERYAGHHVAVMTAKSLSIDKNHRSQLPYVLPFVDKTHGDDAVLSLQAWLEQHFAEPISAPQLARRAALSQRSLNRRFSTATGFTPTNYLHLLRIEAAKRLLETTRLNIQQITSRVGYQDARSFSRLFRGGTGLSPRAYREQFGARADA